MELEKISEKLDRMDIWSDNPDVMERILFALSLLGTTADNYANATIALKEIRQRNPLHNDMDSYLHNLAAYGLGLEQKPDPADWGVT